MIIVILLTHYLVNIARSRNPFYQNLRIILLNNLLRMVTLLAISCCWLYWWMFIL